MLGDPRRPPRRRPALDAAISVAAGAASALAFPPTGLWPVAIIGPAVLLGLLRTASRGSGAVLGAAFGIGLFASLLSWTIDLGYLAWIGLTASQAAFVALFGLLVAGSAWADPSRIPGVWAAVRIGIAWAGIEILRGRFPLGGFTWGGLGYPFADVPLARDLAAIGGVHLIAAVAVAIAALAARTGGRGTTAALSRERRAQGRFAFAVILALVMLAPLAPRPAVTGTIDLAVVQGNVPRDRFTSAIGRRGRVGPEDVVIVENHLRVTEQLLDPATFPPDLVIWPENAFDRDPDEYPNLADPTQALIDAIGVPFIVGAIVRDDDGREFNANLLWRPDAGITDRYEKQHLVPFGEYVPGEWLRDLVPGLREQVPDDLDKGTGSSLLFVDGVAIGQAICFESSYPRDVRRPIEEGAALLLVTTNNATFGESPAARLHLQTSRMRALEHRIGLVHAAISGITGIVDPDGRVSQQTGLFEPALVRAELPLISGRTLYGMIGWELEAGAAMLALVLLVAGWLPGRIRRIAAEPVPRVPVERILVAIPTFNEADTIATTVAMVRAALPAATVMILDDASPDGTGAIADRLAADDPQVEVVHRAGKRGLGDAYLDAFRRAIARGVDVVSEMDADGSHDARELPRLIGAAVDADLVIGSRYVPGGRIEGWSLPRNLLSRAGNLYARIWLGLPVRDATAGFRLYRRRLLESIPLDEVRSQGYAFQVEMTLRAVQQGASAAEAPITFRERRAGESKMSRRIVLEALWRVPLMAIRRSH